MSIYYLECPHCKGIIEIHENEINCAIFRHGIYKDSGLQINPHESKEICDLAFTNALIIGCGKPFRFVKDPLDPKDLKVSLEICDYI
jgi:hypothetical protein